MEETFLMTRKEIKRLKILTQGIESKLSQVVAAKKLGLSERQVRRLLVKIKSQGDESIISRKKGKVSNRCLPNQLKAKAISLLQNHYIDFGPQLANEYNGPQKMDHLMY
jgi:DNA-binding Lrp family transcriptional regulator